MKCATPMMMRHQRNRLTILDQLSVPKTFDDLVAQIQSHNDCRMFFPITGVPRAYMEIPVHGPDPMTVVTERWVYQALKVAMEGTRAQCEASLCEWVWHKMVSFRRKFAETFGEMDPLIVWRKDPEFEFMPKSRKTAMLPASPNMCRVYLRFAIPGLDLALDPDCTNDGMGHKIITKEPVS